MSQQLGRRLGALTLSLAASAALAGPAQAALVAAGPGDGDTVPAYFEDDTGLRLAECIGEAPDPADPEAEPACPLAGSGEHLYYEAMIEQLAVDGGTVSWAASVASADAAADDPATPADETEAAHLDAGVAIQGTNLQAGKSYTITHPYGTTTQVADAQGRFDAVLPAGEIATMQDVLDGPIGPFLRPAGVALGADDELGDPEVATAVVGSPTGNDFVRVQAAGVDARTSQFFLAGQVLREATKGLSGASTGALSFGGRDLGSASGAQSVTISNVGFAPLGVGAPRLSGAGAGDYAVTNGCAGAVAAITGSCSIGVTFTPSAAGARSATLTIPTDGANGDGSLTTGREHIVGLSGSGNAPAPPASAQSSTPVRRQPIAGASLLARPALNRVGVPSRLSRRTVRRRGLTLRLGAAGASRVLVRVKRGRRVVYRRTVATGNRVRLNARALRRLLRRGRYSIELTPIAASGQRGATITRRLTITR